MCEYDYTTVCDIDTLEEFMSQFSNTSYKVITEEEYNTLRSREDSRPVEPDSDFGFNTAIDVFALNFGEFIASIVFNAGLNGETWFYINFSLIKL